MLNKETLAALGRAILSYQPGWYGDLLRENLEAERAEESARRLGGHGLVDLAWERHTAEAVIAQSTVWPSRSRAEVLREVEREAGFGFCWWPGYLTPGRELILLARDFWRVGG
jgi:hypothetical protein